MLTLGDIRIYPVKGLRGTSVERAVVEPWGLRGDRRWMVTEPGGRFLTQRQEPRMAVVGADLLAGGLRLSHEGQGTIEVAEPGPEARTVAVEVWGDRVEARPAGGSADAWLTVALGRPCRLVYMADPATARPVDPEFARPEDRVSFADGFPLLATNAASLGDLNRRLAVPVPMDRFRTNLLVDGGTPWEEDSWRDISVGTIRFEAVKDCARCVVTTVDQGSGVKSPETEPLRTLGRFRRKAGGRIIFGQNLVPRGTGSIAVGDLIVLRDAAA